MSFLEYDTTIPSKFMLGTDSGALLCCSRKARAQPDVITAKFRCFIKLLFFFTVHFVQGTSRTRETHRQKPGLQQIFPQCRGLELPGVSFVKDD